MEFFARDVELVGYHDLDGRPGFKMGLQVVGDRWYLYLGHLWHRAGPSWTSPIRRTPARQDDGGPRTPGPSRSRSPRADDHRARALPARMGGDPERPSEEGVLVWDVAEPADRRCSRHGGRAATGRTGTTTTADGTSTWPRPRRASTATSTDRGSRGSGVSRRGRAVVGPRAVWRAAGSRRAVGRCTARRLVGDRAYLPYGAAGMVILDISDSTAPPREPARVRRRPSELASASTRPCRSRSAGSPSSTPRRSRRTATSHSTSLASSTWPMRRRPGWCRCSRFRSRHRGRPSELPAAWRPLRPAQPPPLPGPAGPPCRDDLLHLTYFNAGLRLNDIRDPRLPREVG